MIYHARLPRFLDGFQPVKDGRGNPDRVLEPLRHTFLLFHLPQKILALLRKYGKGGLQCGDPQQASGEGLRSDEHLYVGAAV